MKRPFCQNTKTITNPFLIPYSIPLNESSKNSYLAQMMHLIVLYNHTKYEKIPKGSFWKKFILKFMQNFRKIPRAVFEGQMDRLTLSITKDSVR